MSTTLVRSAALFLLVVTLAALGFAGMRTPSSSQSGAPVAGHRDAAAVQRIVLVGVPGLSWSDIDEQTPTLLRLAQEATSGSVVIEHRSGVPCATEAWLGLGAVAAVPSSAQAVTGEDTDAAEASKADPSAGDCSADAQLSLSQTDEGTVRLADLDAWQTEWEEPPRQVALGSLATGLRAEGQCLAAYGPLAALAASDQRGVLGRVNLSPLPELNLARILKGRNACPVTLIDAAGASPDQLDERVARIRELLGPNSLLVVAGMPGGPAPTEGTTEILRPVMMVHTGDAADQSGGARRVWSGSTRTPGLIQWTDLGATILTNANVPITANMDGWPVTAPSAADTDLLAANREAWAAITLADRAQVAVAMTWGVILALAMGSAAAWLVYAPTSGSLGGPAEQRGRALLSFVGLAILTLPVATLCASLLPWWRWGAELEAADVAAVGMFRPVVALVLLTMVFGALILGGAWGAYRLVGRHPLMPIAVIAAMTVIAFGSDAATGGGLAMRSVLGAHEIATNRFYGLTSVPFGLLSSAVIVLAGCIASMLYLRGTRHGGFRSGRWPGVGAVVLLGLSATVIIGANDWGADIGGVPAMLVGTLLLSVAAAGRRLSPSVLFLLAIITIAVLSVIAFADWLRPESSRGTAGTVIEAIVNGDAFAILIARLDTVAGVLLDRPSAWLVVALLALAVYAVTARRTVAGGRLLPIWDQHLMRATGGALLATWIVGWMLNDSGVGAVAAGLTIAYGAGLSIAARGREAPNPSPPGDVPPTLRPPTSGGGL
ncbi:MAG: hypothetical protein WA991_00395 [Ornithinimicrobium sp.]